MLLMRDYCALALIKVDCVVLKRAPQITKIMPIMAIKEPLGIAVDASHVRNEEWVC